MYLICHIVTSQWGIIKRIGIQQHRDNIIFKTRHNAHVMNDIYLAINFLCIADLITSKININAYL